MQQQEALIQSKPEESRLSKYRDSIQNRKKDFTYEENKHVKGITSIDEELDSFDIPKYLHFERDKNNNVMTNHLRYKKSEENGTFRTAMVVSEIYNENVKNGYYASDVLRHHIQVYNTDLEKNYGSVTYPVPNTIFINNIEHEGTINAVSEYLNQGNTLPISMKPEDDVWNLFMKKNTFLKMIYRMVEDINKGDTSLAAKIDKATVYKRSDNTHMKMETSTESDEN